jgi:hypothetical protein
MFNNINFEWFMGVVEDTLDPEFLGRSRVRCFGFHTDDRKVLPTSALPWATPMMPVTSASVSEVGQSATGILQGSWVIGFFRDGKFHQDPVIMGTIPSASTIPDFTKGFSDPSRFMPTKEGKDMPKAAYDYGRSPTYFAKDTHLGGTVQDLADPEYPFNKVTRSIAGITIEIDDSADAERVCILHPNGGFIEVNNEGIQVSTSKTGKHYYGGTYDKYITGAKTEHVTGISTKTVLQPSSEFYDRTLLIDAAGNITIQSDTNLTLNCGGSSIVMTPDDITAVAGTINLN